MHYEGMQGSEIAETRKRLGKSQAELARRLGTNQSTVSRWEKRGIPEHGIAQLAIERVVQEIEQETAQ